MRTTTERETNGYASPSLSSGPPTYCLQMEAIDCARLCLGSAKVAAPRGFSVADFDLGVQAMQLQGKSALSSVISGDGPYADSHSSGC